jgi:RNA 2',3'-cyclic 3'-phosphodiesterase
MSDTTIRTFVAIELPDEVAAGLSRTVTSLRALVADSDIKWVTPGNIHVTLKFLGDVPVSRIDEILKALTAVCAATGPMQLEIKELGAFPSSRVPRIVWAGLEGDIDKLSSLASRMDEALEPLGFAREQRPFTPHLTLARVRDGATNAIRATLSSALATTSVAGHLSFRADSASLMKSQLTPRGPLYSQVSHLPMAARRCTSG